MLFPSQFDLGMVYDEPEHCFIHKWLLLTDPNDAAAGAKVGDFIFFYVGTLALP